MARIAPLGLASGVSVSPLVYGTAGKRESTQTLTYAALSLGFCAVDTANQPRAYNEALTGKGIQMALCMDKRREDIWVQSKFTPDYGHDTGKVPYDARRSIEEQVEESIQQSLVHLKLEYIDSVLLHGPYSDDEDNMRAWRALESHVPHTIRHIGVSNFSLKSLAKLYDNATVKPAFVQNRFHLKTNYDTQLRAFAKSHGIIYQAYGMLHGCPELLESGAIERFAQELAVEKELALYLLIAGLGNIQVLNGTTNQEHMRDSISLFNRFTGEIPSQNTSNNLFVHFENLLEEIITYASSIISRHVNDAQTERNREAE